MARLDGLGSGERGLIAREKNHAPGPFCVPFEHNGISAAPSHPHKTEPPFTFRISPLICRPHSVQRNTMGQAMSSGVATRPTGIPSSIDFRNPGCENTSAHMSVSTHPGATEFTLMPDRKSVV